MNWQHLTYFKKVAEYEHLTKAADELFITSSALSKAISALESEIGIPLFEKNGRNIKLNRYGKLFYQHVSHATYEINLGIQSIQKEANIMTGKIRLCSIFSPGTNFLPELLSSFNQSFPHIQIDLSQNMTEYILEKILSNDLDLGICSEFSLENEYSDISRKLLYREEIFLAVPKTHPLSQFNEVFFDDIKKEVFIHYTNNTGISSTIHRALKEKTGNDFKLNVRFSANEPNTITHLISKGLGIGFVIENPSLYTTDIHILSVKDLSLSHSIYLVWNKDVYISPAVQALLNYILSHTSLRTPNIRPTFNKK